MTTLYQYLTTLLPLEAVEWDDVPLKPPGPYALLYEGVQAVSRALHQNMDIVSKSVSVAIYWPPPTEGNLASIRADFLVLLEDVERAVHRVTLDSDGVTPLIAFHRAMTVPPTFDKESSGLMAVVRFTAQLLRR